MNSPHQTKHQLVILHRIFVAFCILASCIWTPMVAAAGIAQTTFSSPEEGVVALMAAVQSNNIPMLRAILGPRSRKLISSGDDVADEQRRTAFIREYNNAHQVHLYGDTKATLTVGNDAWPMPIPMVKSGTRWRFDTRQGEKEILARRIGANELAAIQVCLAIVDAENEYASKLWSQDTGARYADRFVSTPGQRDGLYWDVNDNEPQSPLGPLLAAAAHEGYVQAESKPLAPYHGYYYKILTGQGENAPGGAYDYMVHGRMIGGFAILAYPARYGASGVMSLLVDHEGRVYEKDLGRTTSDVAGKITTFNPDASWIPHQ